jgi:quinol monooxygenase YgiN
VTRMVLEWLVPSAQAARIVAAAQPALQETRGEPGCIGCSVVTELGARATLRCEGVWESEEALRRHVQSDRFRTLAELIESACDPPRIEFTLPDGTRGLDYAMEVRGIGTRQE